MHELMRPDRDDYIILHEENILPGYLEEFRRLMPHQAKTWNTPFDFQSVTLYDPFVSDLFTICYLEHQNYFLKFLIEVFGIELIPVS